MSATIQEPSSALQYQRAELKDTATLLTLSWKTFFEAFAKHNYPQDMEAYAQQYLTTQQLSTELQTTGSTFYFAVLSNEIVGYLKLNTGIAQKEFTEHNSLEVERLYVTSQYQGKGLGSQMLQFAINKATSNNKDFIWLGVWEHNHPAIQLYKRIGFITCGSHDFMLGSDLQTDLLMKMLL